MFLESALHITADKTLSKIGFCVKLKRKYLTIRGKVL
jgi:hypothetical protein